MIEAGEVRLVPLADILSGEAKSWADTRLLVADAVGPAVAMIRNIGNGAELPDEVREELTRMHDALEPLMSKAREVSWTKGAANREWSASQQTRIRNVMAGVSR